MMKKPQVLEEKNTLEIADKSYFSVFQPIYSFSNQACMGAEALIRGRSTSTGFQIPVPECLKTPQNLTSFEFTRLINKLHLSSWVDLGLSSNWIFLNMDFQNLKQVRDICVGNLLKELNIRGEEVVIEVVESEIADEGLFNEIIASLKEQGCLIALDDFGAGHSNIDRIWKAQPDIVKLDRTTLIEASKSVRSQSVLSNLTRLIKESGSIALLEGIETQAQALMAMDVGVDLVQGFYFARPEIMLDHIKQGESCIQEVTEKYPQYASEKAFKKQIQKNGYESLFKEIEKSESYVELEAALLEKTELSFVKRFFILDSRGYQINEELMPLNQEVRNNLMKKGKGLCWKNRGYFHSAVQQPNEVQVYGPYRSLIDMELCLTVSKSVNIAGGGSFVACFDVFYQDKAADMVQISV